MNRKLLIARIGAAVAGGAILTSVAGAAFAAIDDDDIDVNVTIPQITTPGVLAMSVAATSTTLTEGDQEGTGVDRLRVFNGTLPTVTITDTRDAADIPSGSYWYVTGTSTDFVEATDPSSTIPAGNLGWTPRLITDDPDGLVAQGEQIATVLDPAPGTDDDGVPTGPANVGLVDRELLALANDSASAQTVGTWTADADLVLKTPVTVTAGAYTATLTLSLFED